MAGLRFRKECFYSRLNPQTVREKSLILVIVLLAGLLAGAIVYAENATVAEVRTDKTMYMLDPYYWVYSASKYRYPWPAPNPNFWPAEGHNETVRFTVSVYDFNEANAVRELKSAGSLSFDVLDGSVCLLSDLPLIFDENGRVYNGRFDISERLAGGDLFKPGETAIPKNLIIRIKNGVQEELKTQKVLVNRWGCDRCHLAKEIAVQIYPWCAPTGGPLGPHYWGNILGRNNGRPGFTYENLINYTLTHTPSVGGFVYDKTTETSRWMANPLNRPPYHMATNTKQCGNVDCSPCHHGSGHVRRDWNAPEAYPWLAHQKSTEVKCTFCHGMEGGYVPVAPLPFWEDHILMLEQ